MNQEKTLQSPKLEKPGEITSMKTAIFAAPKNIEIKTISLPEPANGEVRIKIEGCGICGSDLPVWQGRDWFSYPREAGAPGHEAYGTIDKIGENVRGFIIGERVAMLSYHAYAQYDIAKATEVVKLYNIMDNKIFPAEPLACAMNIFKRSDITKNDTVAVIGAGFIGNLLIQLSKAVDAKVITISQRDVSLQLAFEAGADHVIKLENHTEIIDKINSLTNNQGCSRVIEATGKQWPLDLAGDIIGTRGKLIIAGFHQDGLRQINVQNWNWKGIDVINAHERDPQQYLNGMKDAVFAVENKIMKPEMLFTHIFPLDEIQKAFELIDSRSNGVMKVLIKCQE